MYEHSECTGESCIELAGGLEHSCRPAVLQSGKVTCKANQDSPQASSTQPYASQTCPISHPIFCRSGSMVSQYNDRHKHVDLHLQATDHRARVRGEEPGVLPVVIESPSSTAALLDHDNFEFMTLWSSKCALNNEVVIRR
jgi:hypothetical protein